MNANITLVATPIGNLSDMSARAIETLKQADVIYAEHPETSKKLAHAFHMGEKKWVLFDQNHEQELISKLVQDSQQYHVVVLARAGMPGVNDPGVYLVRYLLEQGIAFDVIPGPSIVACLMATSGQFGPFHYLGYFPKKSSDATFQIFLSAQDGGTALYLESPHRIQKTLSWLKEYLASCPSARMVLLHEFTKLHQAIYSGYVKDINLGLGEQEPVVGEWAFSLVVSAADLSSEYKLVATHELEKLLNQPYSGRIEKFAKRYGIKLSSKE